jgi:hypothetical protein
MHEPLIDETLFELVQKEVRVKRKPSLESDFVNIFTGRIFCADCGSPMNISKAVRNKHAFTCSVYKRHGREGCGMHYIQYKTLKDIILIRLKQMIGEVCNDTEYFVSELQKSQGQNLETERQKLTKNIAVSERRITEIHAIIKKLYEDNVLGKLTDERFSILSGDYEREQKTLQSQVLTAKKDLAQFAESQEGIDKFVASVQKYKELTDLDEAVIIELIDKIVIHDGVWDDGSTIQTNANRAEQGNRTQRIDIYFNYVATQQTSISETRAQNKYTMQNASTDTYSPQ